MKKFLLTENIRWNSGDISQKRFLKCSTGSKIILAFLFTFLVFSETAVAFQQAGLSVTGTVTDNNGIPLPGVTVMEKGTTNGTQTDFDGNYAIDVEGPEAVLVFTFVGLETVQRTVGEEEVINVSMENDTEALDEVVVVGYGTQNRSRVVAAVDQVGEADLEGRPVVNVTQALQGKAPSLNIQQRNSEPGAGVNLNIRGISTLGNNSPLVVIDGIVGGDINSLNPADIETVSILKDAGSAAIYGSRASNGVVLITTKKGKLNEALTVTYSSLVGINKPHFFNQPVSGYVNAMLRNEAAYNSGEASAVFTPEQIRQFRENGDQEWFADEITEDALQQNHNFSVSGGGENSSYLVSLGYLDQASNFVGPDKGLKRYNFRINLVNQYKAFKLTSTLAYTKRRVRDHSSSTATLFADANRVPLYYSQIDEEGRYLTNDVLQQFNSLGILERGGFRHYDDDEVFGNVTAELSLTNNFKIRGVFGGRLYQNSLFARTTQVDFYPQGVYGADNNTRDENRKGLDLNTQLIAEYNETFADLHDVTILLGGSNENHHDRGTGLFRRYTDPDLGTPITGSEIEEASYNSNQSSSANSLYSVFGRASYAFADKYLAEFTFRYDGSSKFRDDLRWGFFPSVLVGYRLTEESFLQDYRDNVGGIKLRASYGVLGNQNVGNYQYQTTYFTFPNGYSYNNSGVAGAGYNYANPDLQWERAATLNLGADLNFFNNNFTLSMDYFNKVTSDILVAPEVPGVYGTSLPDFNAGKVGSQGWEISATYRHTGETLSHLLSFNVGDNWNEVLDFQGDERLTGVEELQVLLREGQPFNSYVGLKTDGYFQNIDEVEQGPTPEGLNVQPGDIRYVDVNEDGVINDDDKVIFGNPFPRYTFGLTYNLEYKDFDFSLFVQGVGKRTMMIRGELVEPFHFNYGNAIYEHMLDYWTPQNPDAAYPRLANSGSQSNTNNWRRGSDLYLFDGAYARLKNVQLGYSLPAEFINSIGLKNFRMYLSGQNLFTLSKVDFVDPELSEFDSSLTSAGANSARAYPTLVYYGFGMDISF